MSFALDYSTTLRNRDNFNTILSFLRIISASSGNSSELTTIKDLKRSKNKKQKKKAKTKQSQVRQSKPTAASAEAKSQDVILINDKTTKPKVEQQTPIIVDTNKSKEVSTRDVYDQQTSTDKQTLGKFLFLCNYSIINRLSIKIGYLQTKRRI